MAQNPNAISVCNSNGFYNIYWAFGTNFPAGQLGNKMHQALPPELTTYYRNGPGNVRELDARGVEMECLYDTGNAAYSTPRWQVRNTIPSPLNAQRWSPGATIYVDVPSVVNLIPGGFTFARFRIAILHPAVPVPTAPAGTGEAIMGIWEDWSSQYGDGNDLSPLSSVNEPSTGGIRAVSYSGGQTAGGLNFILPNPGGVNSCEFGWTWFFDQSMVQMVINSTLISGTGTILGGGGPPAPFTVQYTDGRAAIHPNVGDVISYNGNSSIGAPVGASLSTVWFAPFVSFEGDIPDPNGSNDPAPEVWRSSSTVYIHCVNVADWINDFCNLSAQCTAPGTGLAASPFGANFALWMGFDLANGFFNLGAFFNGITFADISSGFQWAGPEVQMFDTAVNPGGLVARNPVNVGATAAFVDVTGALIPGIKEMRTFIVGPQAGWTPLSVGPSPFLGYGAHPGGASVSGRTFSMQAWMINTSPTAVLDMTNVAVCKLQ
ncbi:MAG: hypothetical protein ACKVS6_11025 [Planctomycetota bacterium]